MRQFTVDTASLDGETIFKSDTFTFNPGITTLVGCNGAGKTTLMNYVMKQLDEGKTPYTKYYGLESDSKLSYAGSNNTEILAAYLSSNYMSEGERIKEHFALLVSKIGYFVMNQCKDENQAWIFFDSLDSGLSIDNIRDLLDFFKNTMLPSKPANLDLYIVIAANSYEFARNTDCLDVQTAEHMTFDSYDEYADHIIHTAEVKASR